ncbi:imidazole glycerol phosphate synthase subunit HisH [Ruminococcaceae bacterium OttesenSCG-928-I18]|nr:imidazole glycerol phosphate synthase subunit HisH [Ruminococcaceae bacterium OttesenSCG-928-I18]
MNDKITVIDYGVGNLFSLRSSLHALGFAVQLTGDPEELTKVSKIILPGVGAFGDAAQKLRSTGLAEALVDQAKRGKPLLGICLGMQLLFEKSFEFGECEGLGLVPGQVCSLEADLREAGLAYKVPHIGWNPLHLEKPTCPLFKNTREGDAFYFVHSYHAKNCGDSLAASCEYGLNVTAAVQADNVYGTQFHPEKSGKVGLSMLEAFGEVR